MYIPLVQNPHLASFSMLKYRLSFQIVYTSRRISAFTSSSIQFTDTFPPAHAPPSMYYPEQSSHVCIHLYSAITTHNSFRLSHLFLSITYSQRSRLNVMKMTLKMDHGLLTAILVVTRDVRARSLCI